MNKLSPERKPQAVVPVYDILNCGPRNRFVANGKLVHNSAGSKQNLQNLPRGGMLRKAICAPDGYSLVVVDFAAIEARMLAWLAGQDDLVALFERNEDVYCDFASRIYRREITKKDKTERFLGKVAILGLGYSMSWRKFATFLASGPMGQPPILFTTDDLYRMGGTHDHTLDTAGITGKVTGDALVAHCSATKLLVDLYRSTYHKIPEYWRLGDRMIKAMYAGRQMQFGVFETEQDRLTLPNGLKLHYRHLKPSDDSGWSYVGKNGEKQYLYGSKLVENVTQAASRVIMTQAMNRISERYRVVLTVHDECVIVCPEEQGEEALTYMLDVMSSPPAWAKGLPLAAEGSIAKNYGEAK